MSRLIAVLWLKEVDGHDETFTIVSSITDWSEVSDDEFWKLNTWANTYGEYAEHRYYPRIIERTPAADVPMLVAHCIRKAEEHQKKVDKEKAAREAKKVKQHQKKLLAQSKSEKELLKKLKEKYGDKE